ncbi:MAG TPA: hypothetical protein V6C82_04455 [Chroococcales cyanobacterium]|jgi:hypothetical protein
MNFAPSLVAVRKITSMVPRSSFDPGAIDETAQLILKTGALLDPLIVRRLDLESFELLDGHFAFYAAVRARELDLLKGETVLAFIADEARQSAIARQAEILRNQLAERETTLPAGPPASDVGLRLSNFERRFEQLVQGLEQKIQQEHQSLKGKLGELENCLPKPIDALEIFNRADPSTLNDRLKRGGIKGKRGKTLCERIMNEREKSPFQSLNEVVQRNQGISSDGLLKLLEAWEGMGFYGSALKAAN